MESANSMAKRFKKWVTSEVLPDIRRHRCQDKQIIPKPYIFTKNPLLAEVF